LAGIGLDIGALLTMDGLSIKWEFVLSMKVKDPEKRLMALIVNFAESVDILLDTIGDA